MRDLRRHVERASATVRSWSAYRNSRREAHDILDFDARVALPEAQEEVARLRRQIYSDTAHSRVECQACGAITSTGVGAYPEQCGGCDSRNVTRIPMRPTCDHDFCSRPQWSPAGPRDSPGIFRRCALHEIASYNESDLTSWGEENAADMVRAARVQLVIEDGQYALVPGVDF